ncbi:FadR/GntR family transcriptional regulator [Pseudonocardia alaniniphila]|uniref:FadR family transcriptional regulator n=1 Tax=Pseudonocardia alaniniphila TaxID=75291 RepID=A0ABS9T6Y1_9PSEU|nr:FadR/GntR family transcriptional regulator [Pseudonocardia alaniniphila]MCH6164203.1 FadR family transcriptional regulator [Pseudonocardia alaniniphila]
MAVTDEAILRIKAMIRSGELQPGDRLPPEKELSDALGLSRSSLREAVKALEVIRVLDVRQGDGTYVTSLTPDLLLDAMAFLVDIHQDSSALELFEVRRILEPAAMTLAARRAKPADVEHLLGLLAQVHATTSVDDLVDHDRVFHRYIAELTGNAYLVGLLETVSSGTLRARVWRGLSEEGSVERTLTEHHAIVDALGKGDAALAAAQTTVHIDGVARWLRRATGS